MTSITIEVPKGTEKEYKFAFSRLAKIQLEELEDLLLGLHLKECENKNFVSEKEIFNILRK